MAGVTGSRGVNIIAHVGVAGIRFRLIVGMTRDAGEGRVIGGIRVACAARHPHILVVRPRINGEPGVVERGPGPGRRVMARLASGGERRRRVAGISGAGVIRSVAGIAVRGSRREIAVDVAAAACHRGVRSSQGECCVVVIKRRRSPVGGAVAQRAILGKAAGHVIGIRGALEGAEVTRNARRGKPDEYSAGMAAAAAQSHVRAGQRKRGLGVIKDRPQPVGGAVADGAVGREACRHVIGVGGLLEGRQVTARALRRRRRKHAARVALRALQRGMSTRQREFRHRGVVERGGQPGRGGMALFARLRETAADVGRVRGRLEVRHVASRTHRGSAGKVIGGMTLGALHGGVRTRQRKCRLVVIETGV